MAVDYMTPGVRRPSKPLSLAFNAVRWAFMLLGPLGLLALAIIARHVVFEYFHGSEETLRALWHALSP
jgi:hypothetical protein